MAHPALKRFTYFGQLGIFIGFVGAGLVVAALINLIPLMTNSDLKGLMGSSQKNLLEKLFVPKNAGILRLVQFLSTLFLFFLPTFIYAKVCHKRAALHLGFKNKVTINQVVTAVSIMLVALPLSSFLSQLTEMLPFSEATMQKFKLAEEESQKQIEIIGRMNNFGDFLLSFFMLAILPAIFEETIFRGGLQNLLTRWFKMPILAIIITSLIFSASHFSYLGFLSRVALGFVLGWMYYRTGNLWLSIIGHMVNNAVIICVIYYMKINKPGVDLNEAEPDFPIWFGLISLGIMIMLLFAFERVSKHQIIEPGKEIVMEDEASNPFNQG